MRTMCILAALCVASVAALPAQESGIRKRIREEVAEKQRLMREGKVVRSNVRVTVRLRNTSRMSGIVKNGRFVELHDGLVFVSTGRVAKGSGLRLWYYDGTNSFIFLPWESISEHSIGAVLSDEEVAKMGLEFDRLAKRVQDRKAARSDEGNNAAGRAGQAKKPPGSGAGRQPIGRPDGAPASSESPLTPAEQALLAEFPPTEGWGVDRLQALESRKIRVHVYPNEKEQRFIDNFAAWNEAYEKQRAHQAEQQSKKVGPPRPAGGSISKSAKPATPVKVTDPAAKPGK